jgi:hypothetical protein
MFDDDDDGSLSGGTNTVVACEPTTVPNGTAGMLIFSPADASDDSSISGDNRQPVRWSDRSPLQPLPPLTPVRKNLDNTITDIGASAVAPTSNTNTFKSVHHLRYNIEHHCIIHI